MLPKIIEHMDSMPYVDKRGIVYKYGEFFPSEIAPFAYNETIAQEYFTLSETEAKTKGFRWKEQESKNYTITKKPEDLPDYIKDAGDEIMSEVIGCAHSVPPDGGCKDQCTTAFKIISSELQFYRKMNLPLPRLCPNCRHYERLRQRNPLKLWKRKCMCAGETSRTSLSTEASAQAGNAEPRTEYKNTTVHSHTTKPCMSEFETSYAPERLEVIYCEQCYNSEVA